MTLLLLAPAGVLFLLILWVISLRRIVPTNEVHIVQRANKTVSYGKDTKDKVGNTYYQFPAWVPVLGVSITKLPISVFDLTIDNYEAYDKDRLPFVVDIKAFFRIADSNLAASRVSSFKELESQLRGIVQGAARSILAKENLESIMSERNVYGDKFTQEVAEQLKQWGVETVKNIELMDIRDSGNSEVIANIMKKKKSQIEMESRMTVALNLQKAQEAEILANQEIALKQQEANQQVGMKQAAVEQEVGIAKEKSSQSIQEQAKITAQKDMEVLRVREIQKAEIAKQAAIVKAEADQKVLVLNAEADKQKVELSAEAALTTQIKNAEGVKAQGLAQADAEKQLQLAPVEAQIKLAKEIGDNQGYQNYLVALEQIKAAVSIGIEQAKNLGKADIKIFANSGNISDGVSKVSNIFTPEGGLNLSGALETFISTPAGAALANKVLSASTNPDKTKAQPSIIKANASKK